MSDPYICAWHKGCDNTLSELNKTKESPAKLSDILNELIIKNEYYNKNKKITT